MMPLVLIFAGLMLLISGVRGTQDQFFTLVKSDFTGGPNNNGFLVWAVAIGLIVATGYYKPIRPISDGFLVLVFVILFISNKGIASNFTQGISNPSPAPAPLTSSAQ